MRRLLVATMLLAAGGFSGRGDDNMKTTEPGPEHEPLKAFAGTWELTVDGVKEKGSAEFKTILGGRFLIEDTKLPFGDFTMEWHGVYGYDRTKKQYTGIWVDNANNTTVSSTGEADKTGRAFTFRGEQQNPGGGKSKFIWRLSHDSRKALTIEMFEVSKEGKESLSMTVTGAKK